MNGAALNVSRRLRPKARLLWTSHGKVDPVVALAIGVAAEDDLASRPLRHDVGEAQGHDEFDRFIVAVPPVADPGAVEVRLIEVGPMIREGVSEGGHAGMQA